MRSKKRLVWAASKKRIYTNSWYNPTMKHFVVSFILCIYAVAGSLSALPPNPIWYWQLQGKLKIPKEANIVDIDLFDTPKETIKRLKKQKCFVICYFSAGTYEEWRKDMQNLPKSLLGKPLEEWEGERWLDIRSQKVRDIMRARIRLAKEKGCDAIEPDNIDAYDNPNGLGLSYEDQLDYNKFLATTAHKNGLFIALKNDIEQIEELVEYYDLAINEKCFKYKECEEYKPFLDRGKLVLNAEYGKKKRSICIKAKKLGIATSFFNIELDGSYFQACQTP